MGWAWIASICTLLRLCSAAANQSWRKGSGGMSEPGLPGNRFWALPDTNWRSTDGLNPWLTKAL